VTRKLVKLVPALVICAAMSVGCNANKKKDSSTMSMKSAALDIPAAPPVAAAAPAAPAAQYTPPPQPVVYDPPAAAQPVIGEEAVADASDASYAAPASAAPARRMTASAAHPARTARAQVAGGSKYTVKKGESLWTIAQAKYGNGNKWKAIAAANPKIDPNHVRAGQTIVLP
jgi:5'-nucleotidase